MVRCEFLIEPYADDWIDEGGIIAVRPVGKRVEAAQWQMWIQGVSTPDLAGVPTHIQGYLNRAMHRMRLLQTMRNDHMAYYQQCTGKTQFTEEEALVFVDEVESFDVKVRTYGWDSNWGFEELRSRGVLMFDADPLQVEEYCAPKEVFDPDPYGVRKTAAKRLYLVDYNSILSGASLANMKDRDMYVAPNRNFPNIVAPPLQVTTLNAQV